MATEVNVPVRGSENLQVMLGSGEGDTYPLSIRRRQLTFDEFPISEIREACLKGILAETTEQVNWLVERVKAYLEIKDFETVFMLLRTLALYHPSPYSERDRRSEIMHLMVETIKPCIEDRIRLGSCSYLKDALVILCGKINRPPCPYNDEVREVFQTLLEQFDKPSANEEDIRVLQRVLFSIAVMADKTFLPLIRKNMPSLEVINSLTRYPSVNRERIITEGLRMFVIHRLE